MIDGKDFDDEVEKYRVTDVSSNVYTSAGRNLQQWFEEQLRILENELENTTSTSDGCGLMSELEIAAYDDDVGFSSVRDIENEIRSIKKQLKYSKNDLQSKKLNQRLNVLYKRRKYENFNNCGCTA